MQKIDKETEKKFLKAESCRVNRDFEKAISFGATHIRVGSAIFGERVRPPEQ